MVPCSSVIYHLWSTFLCPSLVHIMFLPYLLLLQLSVQPSPLLSSDCGYLVYSAWYFQGLGVAQYSDEAMDWTWKESGLIAGKDRRLMSSWKHPNKFWSLSSFLFSTYQEHFLRGKAAWSWSWPHTAYNANIKNKWSYAFIPPVSFILCVGMTWLYCFF